MPNAIKVGIGIKEIYHYTLHDLLLEIIYRNERDNKLAWLTGARVLEAIGVAFSKNKKYSNEPKILTREEAEEKQLNDFETFALKAKTLFKGKGKK